MSTIRGWALHGKVQVAINYIINPSKTENGLYVYSTSGFPESAGISWEVQENIITGRKPKYSDIVGYHFQYSFKAGTASPEEVLEMAQEWINEISNGQHDYVIAVHVDKMDRKKNPHIHAHIILNPRNNVTKNKFQIFYKKDLPLYKEIADRISVNHGKEILENNSIHKSRGYYEWLIQSQGDTVKEMIQKTIDTVIPKISDYQEFKSYLTKLGYEVEDDLNINDHSFRFTTSGVMLNNELSTEDTYVFKIPHEDEYIAIPKNKGVWINDKKTFSIKVDLQESLFTYDKEGRVKRHLRGNELRSYYDEYRNRNSRKGLRIKAPNSKKFIRCEKLDKNEDGFGYSLAEVIERIQNDGALIPDDDVLAFLKSEQNDTKEELNKFYEEANIKTAWAYSNYYEKSKKERFIEYKTSEIQERLDNLFSSIHENEIESKESLLSKRDGLRADLKEVYNELNVQEAILEQIEIDRLAERLEATDVDIKEYIDKNITPLQHSVRTLRKAIKDIDVKIKQHEQEEKIEHDKSKFIR